MAAADRFEITIEGRGGHAAIPQNTPDAILAASTLVAALNTIVSRRIPPTSPAVLSVTRIAGGHNHNALPASVAIVGTVRTFDVSVQDRIEGAIRQIAAGVAQASGTDIDVRYERYYPATINDPSAASEALDAAATVASAELAPEPAFTSEDFAFMLQACKGAYLWLGQADDVRQAPLHSASYDFNDEVLGTGVKLHVALAERLLSVR
jgi:hippurate hydrolase